VIDLDELEAVANAATEGPWFFGEADESGLTVVDTGRVEDFPIARSETQNARFIATFDPPTVLAMAARIRELKAALRAVEWLPCGANIPESMCPGCNARESRGYHRPGCPIGKALSE